MRKDLTMEADDITRLLDAASDGNDAAMDQLFEVVYPHLREIARSRRRGWQGSYTINTTALVHEAYHQDRLGLVRLALLHHDRLVRIVSPLRLSHDRSQGLVKPAVDDRVA